MDWNGVNFGLSLNLVEWSADLSSTSTQNKVTVVASPLIYGFADNYAMGPMIGGFSMNNTSKETPVGFACSTTDFYTEFNKDSGDITVDNEKFIAAYKEYVRQIIDGFFDKMANPGGK